MDNEAPAADPRVAAYEAMKTGKLINASQLLVCGVLAVAAEPLTRQEIAQQVKEGGHDVSQSGIGSRVGELVLLGVLRELPKRRCRVSEITVATVEMTGSLPAKDLAPVRFTRRQLLRALEIGHTAVVYCRLPLITANIAKELGIAESAVSAAITENLVACNGVNPAPAEGEEAKPGRRKKAVPAAEAAPEATTPETAPSSPQESLTPPEGHPEQDGGQEPPAA